jgi:DNA-directed RNA polymerase specialized sigma24 family protein
MPTIAPFPDKSDTNAIPDRLAEAFSLDDFKQGSQACIDAIFNLYFAELSKEVPKRFFNTPSTIDAEGLVTETLLACLSSTEPPSDFYTLDVSIRLKFEKLYRQIEKDVYTRTKIQGGKKDLSTLKGSIISPLDILIASQEERKEESVDAREQQIDHIIAAAREVLSPRHLMVFESYYIDLKPIGIIAKTLNRNHNAVRRNLQTARDDVCKRLENPDFEAKKFFIRRVPEELSITYKFMRRAFTLNVATKDIATRLGYGSISSVSQAIRKMPDVNDLRLARKQAANRRNIRIYNDYLYSGAAKLTAEKYEMSVLTVYGIISQEKRKLASLKKDYMQHVPVDELVRKYCLDKSFLLKHVSTLPEKAPLTDILEPAMPVGNPGEEIVIQFCANSLDGEATLNPQNRCHPIERIDSKRSQSSHFASFDGQNPSCDI